MPAKKPATEPENERASQPGSRARTGRAAGNANRAPTRETLVYRSRRASNAGVSASPEAIANLVGAAIDALPVVGERAPTGELSVHEARLLERAGADLDDHPDASDPMADSVARFAAILATSLTPASVAERLGRTPARIRQMIHERKLYALEVNDRWHVPAFQFIADGAGLVPNIGRVNEALPEGLDPVSVVTWFDTPDPDLVGLRGTAAPLSPLAWLAGGGAPDHVVLLARGL